MTEAARVRADEIADEIRTRIRTYGTCLELRVVAKFDPDEARDEYGRWTDGGSSDAPGGDTGAAPVDVAKIEAKTEANVAAAAAKAIAAGHTPLPGSNATHPDTIASRAVTAKGSTPHYGQPDLASMHLDQENFEHDVRLFNNAADYPNFRPDTFSGTTDEAAQKIVADMKSNIEFLFGFSSRESQVWYDGARALVDDRAKIYGFNDASIAAVYAALSPGKEWDVNVHQADMLLDVYAKQQDHKWDDAMEAKAATIWSAGKQKVVDEVRGMKLSELTTPTQKALWIRTYNEAHSDRHYRVVRPSGALGPFARAKPGKGGTPGALKTAGWQSLVLISNAVEALEANGDRAKISATFGGAHKVRSFYNNILDPHAANGDVTIDTHAVGVALLRAALGQKSVPVAHNFGTGNKTPGFKGGSTSIVTGSHGTYPLYAEAYRQAAKELGIEPRQLQSAVWVVKREAFGKLTDKQEAAIEEVWQKYHDDPKITLAQAQQDVATIAGLTKDARRAHRADGEGGRAGDPRELHRNELGLADSPVDGRAGGTAPGGAAGLDAFREAWRRPRPQERAAIAYAEAVARAARAARRAFSEDEPRDDHGRWTDGDGSDGGSSSGSSDETPIAATSEGKVTGVVGMPKGAVIESRELATAVERGAYDMKAIERPKGKFEAGRRFELIITAKKPDGIEEFEARKGDKFPSLYDPRLAKLVTEDKGESYERQRAIPNDESKLSITPLDRKDVIYRGMSAEEFEAAKRDGFMESRGEYNIGGAQEGLTYWSTDPQTAESYANGFAPWQFKPTFEKPAYIVAISKPEKVVENPRYDTEVGVPGKIPTGEITAAWRGDVFDHRPGERDAIETEDNKYRLGGGVGVSSRVLWSRIAELTKAFDPDEPRDEQGRWTDGGGSDSGGSSSEKPDAAPSAPDKPSERSPSGKGTVLHSKPLPAPDERSPIKVQIVHDPSTGSAKPYEIWLHYASGRADRRASFKTEKAALNSFWWKQEHVDAAGKPIDPDAKPSASGVESASTPSHQQLEEWDRQIGNRQAELELAGQIGSAEDDALQHMSGAIGMYLRAQPNRMTSNENVSIHAIHVDGKLRAAVTAKYYPEKKVSEIAYGGGLSRDALAAALEDARRHAEDIGAKRIEGHSFVDDAEKIKAYEDAGFRESGQGGGVVRMIAGQETTAEELEAAANQDKAHYQMVRGMADSVARDLSFPKGKISFGLPGEPDQNFVLNGKQYKAAGLAYTRSLDPAVKGTIKLFPGQIWDEKSAQRVTSHEIEHIKFQTALDQFNAEREAVMKEPGPPPNPNGEHWWERHGGTDAMMKPDGTLRPPYDEKYPVYQLMQTASIPSMTDFQKGDGVTSYSDEYWKQFEADQTGLNFVKAQHETLAEMAASKYTTGKFPEHKGATAVEKRDNAKIWRTLYRAVDKVYKIP